MIIQHHCGCVFFFNVEAPRGGPQTGGEERQQEAGDSPATGTLMTGWLVVWNIYFP
jgi:hypothetical protein